MRRIGDRSLGSPWCLGPGEVLGSDAVGSDVVAS